MKKKQNLLAGTSFYCTTCATHLANDPELRKLFKPGEVARYYPETIEILDGVVLIGVVPVLNTPPEMIAVQVAKLSFNERQFTELLKTTQGLYRHYLEVIREADPSIGSRSLPYAEIHKRLKESCLSAQNSFDRETFIGLDDDNFSDIVEIKSRRLKSLGSSSKKMSM